MTQLFMRRADLKDLPALPSLPDGYILRLASDADADALAVVLRAAFDDETWTTDRVRADLLDAPDVVSTFVVDFAARPVATASARLRLDRFPNSGYVHWVGALPGHAGKCLGYLVSLAVLHEFVRLGCRDAVLETDDFRLPAIKTYHNLGFQPEMRDETHEERWKAVAEKMAG